MLNFELTQNSSRRFTPLSKNMFKIQIQSIQSRIVSTVNDDEASKLCLLVDVFEVEFEVTFLECIPPW